MAQTAAELQRSQGDLRVRLRQSGNRTVLGDLYQKGCLKARLPRQSSEQAVEVVTINTAGGLTDGDEVSTLVQWDKNARGVITTQAAERIYDCRQSPAFVNTTLKLDDHAVGCWLPQETILFDNSRLERQTAIELSDSAVLFVVESLVFGRIAMQESLQTGHLFDRLQVHAGGRLVLADALALGGDERNSIDTHLNRKSVLDAARCCATAVFAGDYDKKLLARLRSMIDNSQTVGGASDLGPVIAVRVVAQDSKTLRNLILQLYMACLGPFGFSEPRVWHC